MKEAALWARPGLAARVRVAVSPSTIGPAGYRQWQVTGRVPRSVRPDSALTRILLAIDAEDLRRMRGLTVDARLGYSGCRCFPQAAAALQWLMPARVVANTHPAQLWRQPGASTPLGLEDIAACCDVFPADLFERYPGLAKGNGRSSKVSCMAMAAPETIQLLRAARELDAEVQAALRALGDADERR